MGIFSFVKPGKQIFKTITSVKPSKNIKEFTKHKEDVAKSTEKFSKGLTEEGKINVRKSTSRVLGKISNILKKKQIRKKKMGGGMMGRRFGYSEGKLVGNQKKIDVAAPFGTINAKDFKKLREGKRMQAKDGTGPEQFMRSGVKEDPMRDRKKQPLKIKKKGSITGRGPKKPGEIM